MEPVPSCWSVRGQFKWKVQNSDNDHRTIGSPSAVRLFHSDLSQATSHLTSTSPPTVTENPPSDCLIAPSHSHLDNSASARCSAGSGLGSYIDLLSTMSRVSAPPTMARLSTAAYDGAICEACPWPPPKPPLAFWAAVRVSIKLSTLNQLNPFPEQLCNPNAPFFVGCNVFAEQAKPCQGPVDKPRATSVVSYVRF